MQIYHYKHGSAIDTKNCVIALGFFDGMHIAHRDLLAHGKRLATDAGLPFGIFTFRGEGGIKSSTARIYDTEHRLRLAERAGAEFAVVADFDDLRELTPEEFVRDVIVGKLHAEIAVAGYNFRFGKSAAGDCLMLTNLMTESGKRAYIRDEYKLGNSTVSSTEIRELIINGRIEEANLLLGAPYSISGVVVHGDGRGKRLGLPTINTDIPQGRVTPAAGVYRSAVVCKNEIYAAITNVGTCPTFGERSLHVETHVTDFVGELYGENAEIFLLEYLRKEKRFSSAEELILQIKDDILRANMRNGDITWQELGLN